MNSKNSNTFASWTPELTWDQLTLLDYDKDLIIRENIRLYYETWAGLTKRLYHETWPGLAKSGSGNYTVTDVTFTLNA